MWRLEGNGSTARGVCWLLLTLRIAYREASAQNTAAQHPAACEGELLASGLCLPSIWPPNITHSHNPPLPPYLLDEAPPPVSGSSDRLPSRPPVIGIDVGRQLFVDPFLIDSAASSGLTTTYHSPKYRDDVNPVLKPDQPWEGVMYKGHLDPNLAFASPFSGGMFFDPTAGHYKLWYRCGTGVQCLAYSDDGIEFTKPIFDVVNGTNIVQTDPIDGSTVWLDLDEPDPAARYKMAAVFARNKYGAYTILHSADGVHWTVFLDKTGPIADRSSVFLNPLRRPRKWIYSIKSGPPPDTHGPFGRSRSYWESADLGVGADWKSKYDHAWTNADVFDPPWGCGGPEEGNFTQLYNLDAVAFESVIVGLFSIFTGKHCAAGENQSATDSGHWVYNRTGEWDSVFTGFSRDGFHWFRPVIDGKHRVFLPMDDSIVQGSPPDWRWNKANVQSVGGGFTVHSDPTPQAEGQLRVGSGMSSSNSVLRFYVGARTGVDQIGGNATAGFAELRRDGFASISATNDEAAVHRLVTHPLRFSTAVKGPTPVLFLNAEHAEGLSVSVLDAHTHDPLPGLMESDWKGVTSVSGSAASSGDRLKGSWSDARAVASASDRTVRLSFRFRTPTTQLFSFWIARDSCGASDGWVAAGGPTFNSSRDLYGACA